MVAKPYKPANPPIWGAVLGIFVGVMSVLGELLQASKPDNTLLATPTKAAGTAFAIGVGVALFRNWFNDRNRPGR
jgi:hypothetical protein